MRWIRKNPMDAGAFGAIAVGVAMLLWVLLPRLLPEASAAPVAPDPALAAPYSSIDDLAIPEVDATAKKNQGSVQAQKSAGLEAFGGVDALPGLAGTGGTTGLPRHTVTITMTSAAPIGGVGYIIPTSLRNSYGVAKDVGRRWSLSSAVYGDPAYAQGFAQAGARGEPITCTITVDGKVTDRRSTDGPYGQLYCLG